MNTTSKILVTITFILLNICQNHSEAKPVDGYRKPVIVVSDLYIPAQDIGDNFDIITPYALPQIDLKGVIFDITEEYLEGIDNNDLWREPGFISVLQLNYIFDKNVPCACGPSGKMKSTADRMVDIAPLQQKSFDLFFELLEQSEYPVSVVSTGSCRFLAVAFNRNPGLMKKKIEVLHICAGSSSVSFKEWNIDLDELAAERLLTSGLPIYLYPCATAEGPFAKGKNNTFWSLESLDFVMDMEPQLRNYIIYAFLRKTDNRYFHFLDKPLSEQDKAAFLDFRSDRFYGSGGAHYIWETSVWQQVAGLRLAKTAGGEWKLISESELSPGDTVFNEQMRPVRLNMSADGCFSFTYTKAPANIKIYWRENPELHQEALRKAYPELYLGFRK